MAAKKSNEEETAAKKSQSSKPEEIMQKIRQLEEERERGPGSGGASAAAPAGRAAPARRRQSDGGFFGPRIRDMATYCRQLATLVDVGIPLLRSLQILGERSSNPKLRKVSQDLASRVEEGQPLSSAMAVHRRVFSGMFLGVVRTGEAGGILEESLRRLADLLERRAELKRRVIGAFIYPVIAMLLAIVVICIIVVYAVPKMASAYPSLEDLPLITQKLIGFSTFMEANWGLMLGIIAVVIVLFVLALRTVSGQLLFHRTVLRIPLFGGLARKLNVARFARTLGSLTAAGIPLIDALGISAETADNAVVERTLMRVRATVEHGGKMEEPMRSEPIFDPMVVDMVMVGDEAGALDTMLLKIADTYDTEVDITLRAMTAILEPLLIIFMGIVVGFIALAVFLPYVRLVRNPALMVE